MQHLFDQVNQPADITLGAFQNLAQLLGELERPTTNLLDQTFERALAQGMSVTRNNTRRVELSGPTIGRTVVSVENPTTIVGVGSSQRASGSLTISSSFTDIAGNSEGAQRSQTYIDGGSESARFPVNDFVANPNHPWRRRLANMHRADMPPGRKMIASNNTGGDGCVVCLEDFGDLLCSTTPCLHTVHKACLSTWLKQRKACPLCNMSLEEPSRALRYRFSELSRLSCADLRYIASFVGMSVVSGTERPDLELAILGNKHVIVVSHAEELSLMPTSRVQTLLHHISGEAQMELMEKSDIISALFDSGCVVEDSSWARDQEQHELADAIQQSTDAADEAAAVVNGPLSRALMQSRLVPDKVVLLEVTRTEKGLRRALLKDDELAAIRTALQDNGQRVELIPSGAKVFVRSDQYENVLSVVEGMDLQPRHIIAAEEFEVLVRSVINRVSRTAVKNSRRLVTSPLYSEDPQVPVEIKRTFIHLSVPNSLATASDRAATCPG